MADAFPQHEVMGYARLTPIQRAHFEDSLCRHFLRFGSVTGGLAQPGGLRLCRGRDDGVADLSLEPAGGDRLLVRETDPRGSALLPRLRGFLRSYPRPASFPPLSLRAHDDPRPPPRASTRPASRRVRTRCRLIGSPAQAIDAQTLLHAILPAVWDDADLQSAVAAAGQHAAWLREGRIYWYPYALDGMRLKRLQDAGVHSQAFAWDATADELPALCVDCLGWARADPAGDLPGPPFHVDGSTALWQCPRCGGCWSDDPLAGAAGMRALLSPRMLRDRHGVEPPAAAARWALPDA